jgi:site-specific DNA recombinase
MTRFGFAASASRGMGTSWWRSTATAPSRARRLYDQESSSSYKMQAAAAAEALDRISRDQEDAAGFFKRMRFADVTIVTLAEGEISELHVGLKGTMNALFLKDLADKTRRGLRGRVEAGRSGGGISYGYDVVRSIGAGGAIEAGRRRINLHEANMVRRIFREYSHGVSPREIAKRLNRQGVGRPFGR